MHDGFYESAPICEACGFDNQAFEVWQDLCLDNDDILRKQGLVQEAFILKQKEWMSQNPAPPTCGHCGCCGCCPCGHEDCSWCNESEDPRDILRRQYEEAVADGRAYLMDE